MDNQDNEVDSFVRESVENGKYFEDAVDWYSISHILPSTERSFFVFVSVISVIITYLFLTIIALALPIKERLSIVIHAKDTTKYTPVIESLVNKKEAKSTDEAVLRFLVLNYVKEREEHNYKKADIAEVNLKLERIKNNSSIDVFEDFKKFMSKDNPNSPIHFFGKDIDRRIRIDSFAFGESKETTVLDKMRGFLALESLPTRAYVKYTVENILPDKIVEEKREADLTFKFNGVQRDRKTKEFLPLNFMVVGYQKFEAD